MHPLVRRILRFDFRGKKERAEALAEILVNLEREGKIQIYETYEDGEWDFAWKIIENHDPLPIVKTKKWGVFGA